MFSSLRKASVQKNVPNGTPAASPAAPAAAAPVTIPDLPANSEPMALESLTPRDLVVKSTTSTEVTLQYSLPPTSTMVGGPIDVQILIRPSRMFKQCEKEESELQRQILDLRSKHQQEQMRKAFKPGNNTHEDFMALQREINPIAAKTHDIWRDYQAKAKELLPVHPEAEDAPRDGYYAVDFEQNLCFPYAGRGNIGVSSVRKSAETFTVTIKNLGSNVFYEVAANARRSARDKPENEDDSAIWSPVSASVGFSTKTAPWQLALEKAGLRHLIEPFTVKGLDTFQSWMDITQATKEELSIDAAADAVLSEILAQNGIITPAEQAKIDRERTEMTGVVSNLLGELKASQDKFVTGDAVVEKTASNKRRGPKFGIVVGVNDKNTECAVRWEDPRTKDPANATVEAGVKVSSVQKSQFTLFLSHAQADAQNQVAHLSVLLRDRDAKIWFDQDSERLEARDMVRGIANSKVFLLYLTRTYFDRWFCRLEASVAKALQKQLIIVYEPDERFGGTGDYVSLVNACTKRFPEFKDFLMGTEAVPMARRAFQRRAVVDEICKRAGLTSRPGSFTEKDSASGQAPGGAASGAGAMEFADLKQMVLDLKMELNDLKAENKELRSMVEALNSGGH